jgi:hypothetical protein
MIVFLQSDDWHLFSPRVGGEFSLLFPSLPRCLSNLLFIPDYMYINLIGRGSRGLDVTRPCSVGRPS